MKGLKRNNDDASSTPSGKVMNDHEEGGDDQLTNLNPPKKSRSSSGKASGGHRPLSEVWTLISDGSVPNVHMAAIIICRFCGCEVHTSCKSSRAITHLQRKCVQGRAFLDSIPLSERTQFITDEFFGEKEVARKAWDIAANEVWRWLNGSGSSSSYYGEEQQLKKVECQHCGKTYTFHAKPLKAIQHLKKCHHARHFFDSLPDDEQTEFTLLHFRQEKREREKGCQQEEEEEDGQYTETAAAVVVENSPRQEQGQGQGQGQTVTLAEQKRFSELLALFFFSTGTALRREVVENPYLQEALCMLGCPPPGGRGKGGLEVPGQEQLLGQMLHDMHHRVSELVTLGGEDEEEEEGGEVEEGSAEGTSGVCVDEETKQIQEETNAKLHFMQKHHALLGGGLGSSLPPSLSSTAIAVPSASVAKTSKRNHTRSSGCGGGGGSGGGSASPPPADVIDSACV